MILLTCGRDWQARALGQSSWPLSQVRRIVGSGDENGLALTWFCSIRESSTTNVWNVIEIESANVHVVLTSANFRPHSTPSEFRSVLHWPQAWSESVVRASPEKSDAGDCCSSNLFVFDLISRLRSRCQGRHATILPTNNCSLELCIPLPQIDQLGAGFHFLKTWS